MRGENMWHVHLQNLALGSPPLARGKQTTIIMPFHSPGITPACAGKTPRTVAQVIYLKDHPRLRGENYIDTDSVKVAPGSPPLARGKHLKSSGELSDIRITPACAGKTRYLSIIVSRCWDHPRLRGENVSRIISNTFYIGSPPLARGKLTDKQKKQVKYGITPACAGKTDYESLCCRKC